MVEAANGLVVRSQNAWPSLKFDLSAINGLFSPFIAAGFYYKTFMGPTRGAWMFYEPSIRRAAGLGKASFEPDPDRYEHAQAFCDVLVVGSGPAGLSAALAAGQAGARVILCEEDPILGGALDLEDKVGEEAAGDWLFRTTSALAPISTTSAGSRASASMATTTTTFSAPWRASRRATRGRASGTGASRRSRSCSRPGR